MLSEVKAVDPFDQLRGEHKALLNEISDLENSIGEAGTETEMRVKRLLRLLELHQDAEDRFLLPLVASLDTGLLEGIRREHIAILRYSDSLISPIGSSDNGELIRALSSFGNKLRGHFSLEESAVFGRSPEMLSAAQMDILRIKFAARPGLVI